MGNLQHNLAFSLVLDGDQPKMKVRVEMGAWVDWLH